MRSVQLSRAINAGTVRVRNACTGEVILKFRSPDVADRLFRPYALRDQNSADSYVHLSRQYSAEQLMASNLEDLLASKALELLRTK